MRGYSTNRAEYLSRLRLVEGQERGLGRMIDEDKYCIDFDGQLVRGRVALVSGIDRELRAQTGVGVSSTR